MEHFWFDVPGYFNANDTKFYKMVAEKAKANDVIVEIGTFCGRSISFLAVELVNANKFVHVFGIDPWSNDWYRQDYGTNTGPWNALTSKAYYACLGILCQRNLQHMITLIRDFSYSVVEMFADRTVFTVFVDGGHEYEEVKKDVELWLPKVRIGGYLGGHDYNHPPVKKYVTERFGDTLQVEGNVWHVVVSEETK